MPYLLTARSKKLYLRSRALYYNALPYLSALEAGSCTTRRKVPPIKREAEDPDKGLVGD